MSRALPTPHGPLPTPAFLPDATRGGVRAVDSADLEGCGIEALVMNTFHLMQHPGSTTIQALGGLHQMAGWSRPIFTDSGGFQVYSLIRQNPGFGSLSSKGALFRPDKTSRKFNLTPEKSVQLQIAYKSDVIFCLDDCTHVSDAPHAQREAVERTVNWARRSRAEFDRLMHAKGLAPEARPLLFAVIQGGRDRELRRACAEALLEIGFDGYGYGGWPLDESGKLLTDIIAYTRELIPPEAPMHGLGIAHPESIAICAGLGYDLFDGALPTRDARHGRLYAFTTDPAASGLGQQGDWLAYVYIHDAKHIKADRSVHPWCDCPTCARYSIGYLHHLFDIKDILAERLATLHNLRFMSQLMANLRRR